MGWLFVIGGVLSAWAMLRVMGGEREYRLRDLKQAIEAEAADNARRNEQA